MTTTTVMMIVVVMIVVMMMMMMNCQSGLRGREATMKIQRPSAQPQHRILSNTQTKKLLLMRPHQAPAPTPRPPPPAPPCVTCLTSARPRLMFLLGRVMVPKKVPPLSMLSTSMSTWGARRGGDVHV